jgi:hypoxanthine phosphoribosyltransferase
MVEKKYIQAQELLEDSFRLGIQILKDKFRPNFIVGIWRGGTPVGIVVQELLDYFGIETDHISIRTSAYEAINQRSKQIIVHGMGYIIENINSEDPLLIVDDVFDSGLSVEAVLNTLRERSRKNIPHDIRIAVVYYKPANNETGRVPDYYLYKTDKWLVFPHELKGLTREEIFINKPGVRELIEGVETDENY